MQVEELGVCDLENALCVFLAQHLLDLLVQVSHAHQVALLQVLVHLRQGVEKTNITAKLIPELQSVVLSLDACARTVSGLWELVLAEAALSLEERIDALTFLACFTLFAREIAFFKNDLHALIPSIRIQVTLDVFS